MKFEEYVDSEKTFLHDLSNHLVIIDAVSRYFNNHEFSKSDIFSEKDKEKLLKLANCVDKMILGLQSRKTVVLSESKNLNQD